MEVANLAIRDFVHDLLALLHPSFVLQSGISSVVHRLYLGEPRPFGRRFGVYGELDLLASNRREIFPVIVPGFDWMAINGEDIISYSDLHVILVCRTIFVNI